MGGNRNTGLLPEQLKVERVDAYRWRVPRQGGMNVEGLVFADERLMETIRGDQALRQVAGVACLPGIVGRSIGMPDLHWGYGFAIGGVAAFDPEAGGVISPGGVGYDINCGVRLLRMDRGVDDVRPRIATLMDRFLRDIPSGVGRGYREDRHTLDRAELAAVLERGAAWAVEQGMGSAADLERTESGGCLRGADPSKVSKRAFERGRAQLGTVGSGNHFVELGYVDEVYRPEVAARLGLEEGTVTVFIHSGSRGLGHQVCTDFLDTMLAAARRFGIELPDRQLACAPLDSPEAADYLGAMAAAANYAFANRQVMAARVRKAAAGVLGGAELTMVYDVAHNNAKWETHEIAGSRRRLCVHRKGATRAFPPGHPDLPPVYGDIGQPVLIPGDMGRYSFVLVGTERAYGETFGSTCHGAGRTMSRRQAARATRGRDLKREFRERGIEVRAHSLATIAEEVPEAYKDAQVVVDVVDAAGIGDKVVRLRPLGVLKG